MGTSVELVIELISQNPKLRNIKKRQRVRWFEFELPSRLFVRQREGVVCRMKLQSLRINHFGHFADFELPFGDASFVVLHGQNEAGKSTLLEFLRKALFGFDDRERFAFGDGGEIGGRLSFTLANQQSVELARRKGRKNTVQVQIDGTDAGLDEAGFKRLIGDPDANLFKSIFAFGLDELRDAEQALQHESLRSALYGGGLGGTLNPQQLLADFDAQAAALFKPKASNPLINVLSREIGEASKLVRQLIVKPDDYLERERKWRDEQARAEHLAVEAKQVRVELARVDAVLKALPLWHELRELNAELEQIVVPANFPLEARTQFEVTLKELRRLEAECTEQRLEWESTREALQSLSVDEAALAAQAEIAECYELAARYRAARTELPELVRKHEFDATAINAELLELRPGWTVENLQAFSLSAATRHALAQLEQRRDELRTTETALRAKQQTSAEQLEHARDELNGLGPVHDVSALTLLVEQANEYAADSKALLKEREAREKLKLALDAQRRRLTPPLPPSCSDVEQLAVPPKELALKFEREQRDAQQRLDALQADRSAKEKSLRQLNEQLRKLDALHGSVPKLEELAASRQQRDEQWQAIRTQFIEGDASQSPVAPQTFEESLARADQLADSIYENADAVSQRERLKHDIEAAQSELGAAVAACERQQTVVMQLELQWRGHWTTLGIEPLPPEAMARWVDEHVKFVTQHQELASKDIEIGSIETRCSRFDAALQAAVADGKFGAALAVGADTSTTLAAAKRVVKESESANEQRKKSERDLKKFQKAVESIDSELVDWQARDAKWQRDWQLQLAQLELPSEWSIELVRTVIDRLAGTQTKLKQLGERQVQIESLQSQIADFEPRLSQLAARLSESLDGERLEVTARRLHDRATNAAQAHHRRQQLLTTEQQQAKKLAAKTTEHARRANERADYWRRAGLLPNDATSKTELSLAEQQRLDAEFLQLANRAMRAAQLEQKRAELVGQLKIHRSDASEAEFEARLIDADERRLEERREQLDEQLKELERSERLTLEAAGGLKKSFEELDGISLAAEKQEFIARKQTELVSTIQRYVPLVFAKQLLSEAIQRFEREYQPELIREISALFSSLTRGEYVEIERPTSQRDAIFVKRKDGAERSPDQLSTGTREQLYLAIRLGYIRHYCRGAEPLPIVMDDVLVNFDIERSRATLATLREFSRDVQVLFFTCHDYFVDVIRDVIPEAATVSLSRS